MRKKFVLHNNYFINTLLACISVTGMIILINSYYVIHHHNYLKDNRMPIGAYRYNKVIGYDHTPDFSSKLLDGTYFHKIHKLGYRIPEYFDSNDYQKGGILSIGCSFTYGDGVEAEETFTYLAAQHLGLPSYNYGVNSYSYASSILKLRELKENGILSKLEPSVVVLGAGHWLVRRSLTAFYPSNGFQLGYPYIGKSNNEIMIKNPNEIYSTYHTFKISDKYFDNGTRDVELNFKRFSVLFFNNPRIFIANVMKLIDIIKLKTGTGNLKSFELYTYVINQINEILDDTDARFIILWMPYRNEETIDESLVKAARVSSKLILVDGRDAIIRNNVPLTAYQHKHPQPVAHNAYAQAIVSELRNNKGIR